MVLLTPEGQGLSLLSELTLDLKMYHFPRLDKRLLSGISGFKRALNESMKEGPFDLVHVHGAHELLFLARGRVGEIPFVFTNHGYHGDVFNISYRTASWVCNRVADAVICVSDFEGQKMLGTGLSRDKLHVIHNGVAEGDLQLEVEPEPLFRRFSIPKDKTLIGTVARLVKFKGVEYLIEAFADVVERCPDTHLIIVGTGDELENLKDLAKALDVYDKVSFTGYVKEALTIMSIFDIFALPSLVEPFGMVCAEAMACSKPVVASAVGGIPEIVIPQETGYLVPPEDAKALEKRLEELILDKEMRERLGKNGRRCFEENFTIEKMGLRTLELYQRLWCTTVD